LTKTNTLIQIYPSTMAIKSAAQVRRNEQRAKARGETYKPPTPSLLTEPQKQQQQQESNDKKNKNGNANKNKRRKKEIEKAKAAIKYHTTLTAIEANTELKAKERRSAKRRVEAIACEEGDAENIQELMDWFEETKKTDDHVKNLAVTAASGSNKNKKKRKKSSDNGNDDGDGVADSEKKRVNPYILFIGQIPFDTTSENLFQHFQQFMGKKVITTENVKFRIPSALSEDKKAIDGDNSKEKEDAEVEVEVEERKSDDTEKHEIDKAAIATTTATEKITKKKNKRTNKGYAFCEFSDPELMYECLKLHHTSLNGRRINVLRSAGGGKKARVETQKLRQKEQDDYLSNTVDKITQGYIDSGDLKVGELDAGAILLCKRRSAATVENAIQEYVKEKGEQVFENPSSYFTKIICRVTEEGIDRGSKRGGNSGGGGRARGRGRSSGNNGISGGKKPRKQNASDLLNSSLLSQSGVDMQIGTSNDAIGGSQPEQNNLSNIFPSMMHRGRGRGRGGYM